MRERKKTGRRAGLLFALALAAALCGCTAQEEATLPSTEASVPETIVTEPAPTAPPDGNSGDVTCQGSYTADSGTLAAEADTCVASINDSTLTNSQLQIYYWAEVAAYREAGHEVNPDYSQSLDTQLCDLDETAITWQQYFLQRALNTWHSHQALAIRAVEVPLELEEAYQPNETNHEKYLADTMPALKYLYGYYNDYYEPNEMHQEYLDNLPTLLEELAAANGFGDLQAQVLDMAGSGATVEDLIAWAELYNRDYMYYTQLTYDMELTAEEVEAYFTEHEAAYAESGITRDSGKNVDFRHVLLIPEGATVAADGTVTATEEAWEDCLLEAQTLLNQYWKKKESRFAELANATSADVGSALNGGLYSGVSQGQMTQALDEWLFAPEREAGDKEIIRTACGYHIVYFSASVDIWYAQAEADLLAEQTNALVTDAMEAYPLTVDYSLICLGEAACSGEAITEADVLYPDIAHERFPTAPLFLQQDYPNTKYGAYPIASWGCGITTMAMLASYMTDEEWTPPELCKIYGYYCAERGTNIVMYDDVPAELGFFLQEREWNWDEIVAAIENGQVVACLQYKGYWTKGGHFILMEKVNEDGTIVVRDSNLFNYGSLSGHQIDAHEPSVITPQGAYYWIYQHKITRIPACVRCDDTDHQGVPSAMFAGDYYCAKCQTAMARRDRFLNACEMVK